MEESFKKDLATEMLTSYLENTEENVYQLFEAVYHLENYLEEDEHWQVAEKQSQPERYDKAISQLALIADKLFVAKEYALCCKSLEAALKGQNYLSDQQAEEFPPKANLLLKLGSSNLQLGNTQDATDNALMCLKEGIQNDNKVLQMQSCIILANAYQRERSFLESINYHAKMLGLGNQLNSHEKEQLEWTNQLECKILWNVSACYDAIGDTENALLYAKLYLETVKYGSQDNMTSMYSYIGKLLLQTCKYREAMHMHEIELSICKRFRDRFGMANAYGNIGLVYAAMGNGAISSEFLAQQFRIAKCLENSDLLLNAIRSQAEAYVKLEKRSSAIENFKSLLKLAKENHLWTVQCMAYKNIGKLYQEQGTLNFARYFLEEAMTRARECNMKQDEIDAEMHLAEVLHILGYHEESRKHFKEVILYFEKIMNTIHQFEILPCSSISLKLENCCKILQDVLVKRKCYGEALEIAELSRSRIYFNILKNKNSVSNCAVDSTLPLTVTCMETILMGLPHDTVILYYSLSENGYHLWMMRPEKGLIKFVTQNSMATCPIDTLVRDCIRSLAISKKGNRCCYETEYKRKKLVEVKSASEAKNMKRDQVKMNLNLVDKASNNDNVDFDKNDFDENDAAAKATEKTFNDHNMDTLNRLTSTQEDSYDLSSIPMSPLKLQKDSTHDSGYDSTLSRGFKPGGDTLSTDIEKSSTDITSSVSPDFREMGEGKSLGEITESTPECEHLLRELFGFLLGHVEHLLSDLTENNHIVFIPDGVLNMVPFHLLRDKNRQPLHEKFKVSVMPCLAAVARHAVNDRRGGDDAVVIGNSCLHDASFKNINGHSMSHETVTAEEELDLVSKLLGVRGISGREATKDLLMRVLPDAEIVHIASIGSLSDGRLLLTPNQHRQFPTAEPSSFVFDLSNLSQLDLKAKLVILSSCCQCPHGMAETAVFNMNLATGFLGAGAAAVVVFLYSLPHKIQMLTLHRLFRHLEEGKTIAESLQLIYNTMNVSEELKHPGNWGGIALVGNDTRVDIKSVRRKALEKTIDEGSDLIRHAVCIAEPQSGCEEFSLANKAKRLQSLLASLLSIDENLMVLDSLQELILFSIEEIQKFQNKQGSKQIPSFKISNEISNLRPVQDFLHFLGYKVEPSLEDADIKYLTLPPWNFDEMFEKTLSLVRSLHALRSLSKSAAFFLSRCLESVDNSALYTLYSMLQSLLQHQEHQIYITDPGIKRLWASNQIKQFLQEIGFYEINTTIFLRNGSLFDALQHVFQDLLVVLLSMYRDGEIMMSKLSSTKMKREAPWFTKKPTTHETRSKNLLAERIHSTKEEFGRLNRIGRQWHDATLESWNWSGSETVQIGPAKKEHEKGERIYHGQLKLKVKPGGTPSSCRFPIIQKKEVTKYDRYRQREDLEKVHLRNNDVLSKRRQFELFQSFQLVDL